MPNCQKLHKKLNDLRKSKDELADLLDKYQQTGTKEDKQSLTDALDDFSFEDFRQYFQEKVEGLLSEHPHSQEFEGKIAVEEGRVIIMDDLNFRAQADVYLPAIINKVEGYLDLHYTKSAKHLELPDTVVDYLDLSNLESAEYLELPQTVEGAFRLRRLKSAEHLELPEIVGGDIWLNYLESPDGLKLHDGIEGDIYLNSLSEKERKQLRDEYPNLAGQIKST